jgi:hypothetical protein
MILSGQSTHVLSPSSKFGNLALSFHDPTFSQNPEDA